MTGRNWIKWTTQNMTAKQMTMLPQTRCGSLIQLVDDDVQLVLDLVEPVVEVFDEMSDPEGNGEHRGQQRPQEQRTQFSGRRARRPRRAPAV
jgi:hypothetical protein